MFNGSFYRSERRTWLCDIAQKSRFLWNKICSLGQIFFIVFQYQVCKIRFWDHFRSFQFFLICSSLKSGSGFLLQRRSTSWIHWQWLRRRWRWSRLLQNVSGRRRCQSICKQNTYFKNCIWIHFLCRPDVQVMIKGSEP